MVFGSRHHPEAPQISGNFSRSTMGMAAQGKLIGTYRPHVLGADGQPRLQCPISWKGPVLERLVIPTEAECGFQFAGTPVVFASKYSPGRRWYRCGARTQEIPLVAPGVDVLGATYERDHERWQCEPGGETLCVRFHPSAIEHCIQEEAYRFDFDTRYSHRDDFLVNHLFVLAGEIESGMPNGSLFSEGLSMMVIGWLSHHYVIKAPTELKRCGTFSPKQQSRIREFIDTFLDTDLSIEQMAAELKISPYYFSRLFRASFGVSPHRYVLQLRLGRASRMLLRDGQRPIADIALMNGFSSQAHFTSAFKRHMGDSPARWRADRAISAEE